jgi:hypothetical protein
VAIEDGARQWFSVVVEDSGPADQQPPVRWLLDGRVVADNTTLWEYDPAVAPRRGNAPLELRVLVGDGKGSARQRQWELEIAPINHNPVLQSASYKPGSTIYAQVGDVVSLRVSATDADGDRLSFAWTVDGKPAGSDAPELDVTVAGDQTVSLAISDGKASVFGYWKVDALR